MTRRDGRDAKKPYRVRAGATWYWVDPTVPVNEIEPGDTVILYAASGEVHVAVLQGRADVDPISFSDDAGVLFTVAARDVAALHLALIDPDQE